jgi:hypothetical protein
MGRAASAGMIFLWMLLAGHVLYGQEKPMPVINTVFDEASGKRIRGALVVVENKSTGDSKSVLCAGGRGRVTLEYGYVYHLIYSADGYHTKKIEVDITNVPPARQHKLKMDIEVDLFQVIPGFDDRVLDKPMSRALYKFTTNNLGWDTEYYRERLKEVDAEKARSRAN